MGGCHSCRSLGHKTNFKYTEKGPTVRMTQLNQKLLSPSPRSCLNDNEFAKNGNVSHLRFKKVPGSHDNLTMMLVQTNQQTQLKML